MSGSLPDVKPFPSPTPFSTNAYLSPEDMDHIAEAHVHPITGSSKGLYGANDYLSPEEMEHIAEEHTHHTTDDSKAEDPLLHPTKTKSLANDQKQPATTTSPSKSTFTIDEEKNITKTRFSKLNPKERHKRALDLTQRVTSFLISIAILVLMTRAYVTFLKNKDVTAGGESIYPSFMKLWPTYMMIAVAAGTCFLNACVVYWRVHGTIKDQHREEMYSKYWDYALHVVNFLVWVVTSSAFVGTKYLGGADDPNVLWGYVCSSTANDLNEKYPQIVKFYIECNIQNVGFLMSVSEWVLEGFALATKMFVKLGVM